MVSEKGRAMADRDKFLTVGQVMRGGGPPIDPEEARKLRERVAGAWAQHFRDNPHFEEIYGPCKCALCAEDDIGD